MKYENPNTGLLNVKDVEEGTKIKIIEEAYVTVTNEPDTYNGGMKKYWNVKVELPNGDHKLASIFGESGDKMKAAWGEDTKGWVGKIVSIVLQEGAKGQYILLEPAIGGTMAGEVPPLPTAPEGGREIQDSF